MEDIKDIQKTAQQNDGISRFLDAHAVRTNPFGDNRAADRAYRRAERMVAALYLLTNHVPNSEPVKAQVREHATALMGDMLTLRDDMRSPQSGGVHVVLGRLRQLISLVRVLTVAGYISIQNAETMIEALDDLGNFLTASQRSMLSENLTLSREDLMDITMAPHVSRIGAVPVARETRLGASVKDTPAVKDNSGMSDKGERGVGARAQQILEVLRTGGSLGIRDIAANLPEYSEKMIQRELLDLVQRGAVRKIGLKRWSKYAIGA